MRRPSSGGFTIMEILVSLAILVIGTLGVIAMSSLAIRGNDSARRLEQASAIAADVLEETRERNLALIVPPYLEPRPDVIRDGRTFHTSFRVDAVAGQPGLLMVTSEVWYGTDGDESVPARHFARQRMIRSIAELLL